MNFYEFTHQVLEYKKAARFNDALKIFKENKNNFPKEQIANDKYLISNIIMSLRKTNNSKFVNSFLYEFDIVIDEQIDEIILTAYGWVIYENIKINLYAKYQLIQATQNLIYLLSIKNSNFSYSIISNIFRLGIKLAKEHQNQDFNFTNDFCNLFDKNILTLECYSVVVKGKNTEQASDKEKWYSEKSKALFELNIFQECFEISQEALHYIDKFHNNSDLWFARRIALSKKQLGNIDEAIADLQKIYAKKQEWFIQKEIADLYFEKNDTDNAFKNAIQAANTKEKLEFKVGLIFLIGKILKQKNEPKLAYKHFLLIKKIREENQWSIPNELMVELNSLDISLEIEIKNLLQELKKYWQTFLPKHEALEGVIKVVLNDNEKGKNGFLTSNQVDYYFVIPLHTNFINGIEEKVKVEFEIQKLSDSKEKAIIINIID